MSDHDFSKMLAAVAALLLRPPDAAVLAALADSSGVELDPARARQDFYDVLCVPQSGRYVPPYAQALAKAQVKDGNFWHFPPARFDGGDALAPWYQAAGFDPQRLDVDPMLRGPHRPLDNVGFIFAYLAGLFASRERGDADAATIDTVITTFVTEHLGVWLDRFCALLGDSRSPYLEAVAGAVKEAEQAVRARCPSPAAEVISAGFATPP